VADTDDLQNGTTGTVTLADKLSVAFLGTLALAVVAAVVYGGFMVFTGQITANYTVGGTLPIGRIYGTVELIFIGFTLLAFLEVYGKAKVKWLLDRVNLSVGGQQEDRGANVAETPDEDPRGDNDE